MLGPLEVKGPEVVYDGDVVRRFEDLLREVHDFWETVTSRYDMMDNLRNKMIRKRQFLVLRWKKRLVLF